MKQNRQLSETRRSFFLKKMQSANLSYKRSNSSGPSGESLSSVLHNWLWELALTARPLNKSSAVHGCSLLTLRFHANLHLGLSTATWYNPKHCLCLATSSQDNCINPIYSPEAARSMGPAHQGTQRPESLLAARPLLHLPRRFPHRGFMHSHSMGCQRFLFCVCCSKQQFWEAWCGDKATNTAPTATKAAADKTRSRLQKILPRPRYPFQVLSNPILCTAPKSQHRSVHPPGRRLSALYQNAQLHDGFGQLAPQPQPSGSVLSYTEVLLGSKTTGSLGFLTGTAVVEPMDWSPSHPPWSPKDLQSDNDDSPSRSAPAVPWTFRRFPLEKWPHWV